MPGQPVPCFTLNGTKRNSQGPVLRPEDTETAAQQFWTQFWTERLQALKCHLDCAQTGSSDTGGRADAQGCG